MFQEVANRFLNPRLGSLLRRLESATRPSGRASQAGKLLGPLRAASRRRGGVRARALSLLLGLALALAIPSGGSADCHWFLWMHGSDGSLTRQCSHEEYNPDTGTSVLVLTPELYPCS